MQVKVALITGGGAGIGRACVRLFAREGAKVVVAAWNEAIGAAAAKEMADEGYPVIVDRTDVTKAESAEAMVNPTIADFAELDIFYNNVGGSTLRDGPVTTAPAEGFWSKLSLDAFSVGLGCHYAIPHMIAGGGGSIVNASPMCALIGTPGNDAGVYRAKCDDVAAADYRGFERDREPRRHLKHAAAR